jgi:chromosome segregation ATPase
MPALDLNTIVVGITSGVTVTLSILPIVIAVARAWATRHFAQDERMRIALEAAMSGRVDELEARMASFQSGCAAKHAQLELPLRDLTALSSDLRNAIGWIKTISLTVDNLNKTLASLQADLNARVEWLRNLNQAMTDLRGELHGHTADRASHGGK